MSYEYKTQGYNVVDAGRRLVVDPVTRIEGHLRCEVNINDDNVITNAVSCGTIFRGIEIILKGRDPRDAWAFTERICGVCTGTHALSSVQAVENALGIDIPDNANIIRNLMQLCLMYHDHLVHLYHLTGLDWVDVVSASTADPKATSELAQKLSPWPNSSPGYFQSVKDKLLKLINSGQLGIFTNGYWGHPAYKLPPEANLMVVAHYIEALDFQKDVVHIHTIFGGKNPHPNWLVGGVPCSLNIDGVGAADVINQERLDFILQVIERCRTFAQQVVIPDTLALASFYGDWLNIGGGLSKLSVLAYGGIPDIANDYTDKSLLLPPGAIINGNFNEVLPVSLTDPEEIQETVNHSWYKSYPAGKIGLHPWEGITEPHYNPGPNIKGTPTALKQVDERDRYSWLKTPLWRGHQMEVGPLARMLIGYARKNSEITDLVDDFLGRAGGVPVTVLQSTLGRIAARSLELAWSAEKMRYFYDRLITNLKNGVRATANTTKWKPETWPTTELRGVGFTEAPRGALGHWIKIKDRKIENYQCVVPTTWNGAPRSPDGQLSAYEASLMNTHMDIPEQPLEILRTLHSFDPCLACSTHIIGPDGKDLLTVRMDRGM
ncbi:nickel-dependent hydrogenase large subunit [Desulfovibrio intestinalis]|uniref:Periplasmic [NiFe] hydrogenase large subunit n=1 Tax=Desulfovibrio intestinalis TaxID=58621 RepID=A0A7W8FD58_9BACT|nr:nickel-dependent hydrogenase large subunit [Desulfovibrio intestinalis]MBB5142354.1 hydrogenase large subunit [Desulfovibrio intestinalis]